VCVGHLVTSKQPLQGDASLRPEVTFKVGVVVSTSVGCPLFDLVDQRNAVGIGNLDVFGDVRSTFVISVLEVGSVNQGA